MKLTIFKGLAYDLSDHLKFLVVSGQLSNKITFPLKRDVLDKKDEFDRYCINFIRERVPNPFDFSRVKKIFVSIRRSAMLSSVKVEITVDDKVFSNTGAVLES